MNNFRKIFIRKEKKKKRINVLTVFYIFHKNEVKLFLKWFINNCSKNTR